VFKIMVAAHPIVEYDVSATDVTMHCLFTRGLFLVRPRQAEIYSVGAMQSV
jgi:hypothetical protein